MESYQPWPIFNVQNELAGVQKKGGATIQIRWMIHGNFFQQMIELPTTPIENLPPPYHHRAFNDHITLDLFFFQRQGMCVVVVVGATLGKMCFCVSIHACLHTCGYTYLCWLCACFLCTESDDRYMCNGKMVHLLHIHRHLKGEWANWTDDLKQTSGRCRQKLHTSTVCVVVVPFKSAVENKRQIWFVTARFIVVVLDYNKTALSKLTTNLETMLKSKINEETLLVQWSNWWIFSHITCFPLLFSVMTTESDLILMSTCN